MNTLQFNAAMFAVLPFFYSLCIVVATAQVTPQVENLQNQIIGSAGAFSGGGLSVTPANGNVSYRYPISSYSVSGYPINVSLDYCGGTSMTTFTTYFVNTASGCNGCDGWIQFNKIQPSWLISVNGFVVQALTRKTTFFNDPQVLDITALGMRDYLWQLDGYDYCNRMNKMLTDYDQDVIKILLADGGMLELRNANQKLDIDNDDPDILSEKDYYTGYYYSNGINGKGYGIVEYADTTEWWPGYISDLAPGFPDRYAYLPRILRYYDGSGLEYVFREHPMPYGTRPYKQYPDAHGAYATVFYLEEINSSLRTIASFRYSRHNFDDNDERPSQGRALLTEFDGHRFTYGDNSLAVEALGRTVEIKFKAHWGGMNDNFSCELQNETHMYDVEEEVYDSQDYTSRFMMVTAIRDPEAIKDTTQRKATTFDYEHTVRSIEDFHFPVAGAEDIQCGFRLGRVTAPTGAYDSIQYYSGDDRLTASEVNLSTKQIIYDLSHTAHHVFKYDRNDQLLAQQEITFTGPVGYYTRVVEMTTQDEVTGHTTSEQFYYRFHEVAAHKANTHQKFMTPKVVFPALEKKVTKADDVIDTVITTYTNTLPDASRFVWVPVTRHTMSKQGSGPMLTTSYSVFSYEFEEVNDFGGDNSLSTLFGRGLLKRTTEVRNPSNTSATLMIGESTYLNLPMLPDEPVTRTDSLWKENDSRLATAAARRNGQNITVNLFTTHQRTNEPMNIPPIYGLLKESYSINPSDGKVIAGVENTFEETFDGLTSPTFPRGALKSNKVVGYDGREISGTSITYSGGWYRNIPRKSTNNAGGQSAVFIDYADAPSLGGNYPSGTKVFNTNSTTTQSLFDLHHIAETPVAAEQYVRYWDPVTLSEKTRTLASYNERTFHGQIDGVVDPNGWYSASEYDLNGRTKKVRLPFDFPEGAYCDNIGRFEKQHDNATALVIRPDTLDCGGQTTTIGVPGSAIAMPHRLIAAHLIGIPDSCSDPMAGHEVYDTKLYTATITYTAGSNDAVQTATSVTSAKLQLHPTAVTTEGCATIKINLREFDYSVYHTFSCPPLGGTTTATTGAAPFTVDLMPVLTDLHTMSHNDRLHIDISMETPGASVEFAAYSDDVLPVIHINGSFPDCDDDDFTFAFSYDDIDLETTTYSKVDDNLHTTTPSWAQTWSDHAGRYAGSRDNFRSDGAVRSSYLLIDHPDTYTRIDSVFFRLAGYGYSVTATNPYGDSVYTVYDELGRVDSVYNPDGTFITVHYEMSTQATYGISTLDQDFFGVCYRTITISEGGLKQNAEYRDAFGRVRRTVEDVGGEDLTVKYEYDAWGRLATVYHPDGTTTEYFYDDFHRIKRKENNDIGIVSYAYDDLGNVRFTQTQEQADNNRLTFTQYDDLNRPTVIGEAKLSGIPSGDLQGGAPSIGRATESIDPNYLQCVPYLSSPRTVNRSMWYPAVNSSQMIPFWSFNTLGQTTCLPPLYALAQEETTPVGPYLVHPVNYYSTTSATATATTFENISSFPQHVLTAIHYDVLPTSTGAVWHYFPTPATWNALTPKGQVRNLKGRQAAVAYREHGGEAFHYVVSSYDERGRIEALLRYTENLGFDAVYYTYNSADQVLSVRVCDPLRQYTTWYGYDNNGRMVKVWTKLSAAGQGLGVTTATYAAPQSKPATEDMTLTYDRLGRVEQTVYLPEDVTTQYGYNLNGYVDSLFATASGIADTLFKQVLFRDDRGRITGQRSRHASAAARIESYLYDGADRLANWTDNGTTYSYTYDVMGNRLTDNEGSVSRSYSYTDNRLEVMTAAGGAKQTLYTYDANGSLVSRVRQDNMGGVWNDRKIEHFEYTAGGLTRRYVEELVNPLLIVCTTSSFAQNASERDWRYRYSATGAREQKRLYYSPEGDGCGSSHLWTYYLLGAGDEQLAVYNGRQTVDNDGCSNTGRRVHMYAVEYNSFCGSASITTRPDGSKELNLNDHLGSVRSVVKSGGTLNKYDYRPFGALHWSSTGTTKREGFISKEFDQESSLGDFGVRKYDAEIGRFLSVDPLWEIQPGHNPYHYAYNDPINGSDGSGMFTVSMQTAQGFLDYYCLDWNGDPSPGCGGGGPATDNSNTPTTTGGGGQSYDNLGNWGGYLHHVWMRTMDMMSVPNGLGNNSGLGGGGKDGGKQAGKGNSNEDKNYWVWGRNITPEQVKQLHSYIAQSPTLTYLFNQINIELQKRDGEVSVKLWDKGYSVVSSLSSAELKYNGKGTKGVFFKLAKDLFSKSVTSREKILHLVHEFYHIYEFLTGTMVRGTTADGLDWSEAYAQAWRNYAAKEKGWKQVTDYYDPVADITYPLPALRAYPDQSKLPQNKLKKR